MKHSGLRKLFCSPAAAATLVVLAFGLGFFLGAWRSRKLSSVIYAVAAEQELSFTAQPEKLDLNSADAEELEALPGIGPALAERIVAYREENGLFAYAYEITDVSGIGSGTYEAIRELITVNP